MYYYTETLLKVKSRHLPQSNIRSKIEIILETKVGLLVLKMIIISYQMIEDNSSHSDSCDYEDMNF